MATGIAQSVRKDDIINNTPIELKTIGSYWLLVSPVIWKEQVYWILWERFSTAIYSVGQIHY